MPFKPALFIFLSILILPLAACGGGGGAGSSANSLTVISTDPPNGASTGSENPVTVTFSKEMDPATLTSATFKISGITGMVTSSGKTASFTPADDFAPQAAYTATVTTGAKDKDGNPLVSDYSW